MSCILPNEDVKMTPQLPLSEAKRVSDLEKILSVTDNHSSAGHTAPKEKESFFHKSLYQSIGYVKRGLEHYFTPNSVERWGNGRIYKWLGVQHFKKILPIGGDYVNRKMGWTWIIPSNPRRKELGDYESMTKGIELAHSVMIPLYSASLLLHHLDGDFNYVEKHFLSNVICNVLFNIYPIMVQRYNRTRIYTALEKVERRK